MKGLALLLLLDASAVHAESWDKEAGIYALSPLPAAASEAIRLDPDERMDQRPLGRTALVGKALTVTLPALPIGVTVDLIIGFRPMWEVM